MFSTYDPDTLMSTAIDFANGSNCKTTLATDKFKAKVTIMTEQEEQVEMKVRVLKVDEGKNCVEVTRVSGDQMEFYKAFNAMREFFDNLNDTAY
jgi:hypothetical protein